MFEHLDDPHPPTADAAARRTVERRAATLGRRQRLLVALSTAALVAGAGSGVGLALANQGGHKHDLHVVITPPTSVTVPPTTMTLVPSTVPPLVNTTLPTTTTTTVLAAASTVSCAPLNGGTSAALAAPLVASATLGSTRAVLAGSAATVFGQQSLTGATLAVYQGGQKVVSLAVTPPKNVTQPGAVIPWSIGIGTQADPLCVAQFGGAPGPTVLLGLTLGGAHCCTILRAVSVPGGTVNEIDLGNPAAVVTPATGGALIATGDDAFNYAFASFASSGVPLKILELRHGQFVDTTRQHPDLIATDAARWLSTFNQSFGPTMTGLGVLAAWVGDECLVGRFSSAWAAVNQYNAQGRLTGPSGWPTGSAYVSALRSFLTQHGYC